MNRREETRKCRRTPIADSGPAPDVPFGGRPHLSRFRAHYRRPEERPFTADERSMTTILIGNLTPKHEALLRAVFERNGYRIESLPEPTKKSYRTGKEHCNNGLCNPVYYTAGALIEVIVMQLIPLLDTKIHDPSRTHDVGEMCGSQNAISKCRDCRFRRRKLARKALYSIKIGTLEDVNTRY